MLLLPNHASERLAGSRAIQKDPVGQILVRDRGGSERESDEADSRGIDREPEMGSFSHFGSLCDVKRIEK